MNIIGKIATPITIAFALTACTTAPTNDKSEMPDMPSNCEAGYLLGDLNDNSPITEVDKKNAKIACSDLDEEFPEERQIQTAPKLRP